MQAHTLGEIGNLGAVLLRVSAGTVLPIFIEIGLHMRQKEQNISWHSFFETQCIYTEGYEDTLQLGHDTLQRRPYCVQTGR